MSAITFSVIDTDCERADQSFFPPKVALQTNSSTQIATVLGFDEMPGFVSTPPRRYHTLTWQGHSEQQLFSDPLTQIAGARVDYGGASNIDAHGAYTSLYTKDFTAMCDSLPGNSFPVALNALLGGLEPYFFKGWLGPAGHEKCPAPGLPYADFGNIAIGRGDAALRDFTTFWGSKPATGGSAAKVANFNYLNSTQGSCVDAADSSHGDKLICIFDPLSGTFPSPIDNTTEGTLWFFGIVNWEHNYSVTLSNEYTDAEALANAQVFNGDGAIASNFPRTTGFVSTFTRVGFSLILTNLIVGNNYVASVEFFDPNTGAITLQKYAFNADKTSKTIPDSVPFPAPFHNLQVRNPKVVFA